MTYADDVVAELRTIAARHAHGRDRPDRGDPVTLVDVWTEGPDAIAVVYRHAQRAGTFGLQRSDLRGYAQTMYVDDSDELALMIYLGDLEEPPPPQRQCVADDRGILWWGDELAAERFEGISVQGRWSAEVDEAVLDARDLATERGDPEARLSHLLETLAGKTPRRPVAATVTDALGASHLDVVRALRRAEEVASARGSDIVERRDVLAALQEALGPDSAADIDSSAWVDHRLPYSEAFKSRRPRLERGMRVVAVRNPDQSDQSSKPDGI